MVLSSGFRRALLASGVAVLSALVAGAPARAGFSPEQLAGFEVTHIRGTVTTVLPDQKVLEIVDPEGHKEIITVGIDMARWELKWVTVLMSLFSTVWWWI